MRMLSVLALALCTISILSTTAGAWETETRAPQLEEEGKGLDGFLGRLAAGISAVAPQFPANPHRNDPYKRINFRVSWGGELIAGVTYVSPISRQVSVVEHRSGSDPSIRRFAPGLTTFSPITLKRGVTHDMAFEQWANLVWNPKSSALMSLKNYRHNVTIDLLNLSGNVVKTYNLHRCWPTNYIPLAELNADTDLVAEEILTIQCEYWDRDEWVAEQSEG